MARRMTTGERVRRTRGEEAELEVRKLHPDPDTILLSWIGVDLVVDVKDHEGTWHRYYHTIDNAVEEAAVLVAT